MWRSFFNKIFSGWQPRQIAERRVNQRFEDHLCPRHRGTDYFRSPSASWYTCPSEPVARHLPFVQIPITSNLTNITPKFLPTSTSCFRFSDKSLARSPNSECYRVCKDRFTVNIMELKPQGPYLARAPSKTLGGAQAMT